MLVSVHYFYTLVYESVSVRSRDVTSQVFCDSSRADSSQENESTPTRVGDLAPNRPNLATRRPILGDLAPNHPKIGRLGAKAPKNWATCSKVADSSQAESESVRVESAKNADLSRVRLESA